MKLFVPRTMKKSYSAILHCDFVAVADEAFAVAFVDYYEAYIQAVQVISLTMC